MEKFLIGYTKKGINGWEELDAVDNTLMDLYQNSSILSGLSTSSSPLEIFEQFFDNLLIQKILDRTNEAARINHGINYKKHKAKWRDITIEEFKIFIGVIIMMGIIKLPEIHNHWQKNTSWDSTLV